MVLKSAKVLIATIGLCLGSAAIAQDLVYIYTDESTGAVWYYDAETIRRNSIQHSITRLPGQEP